LLFRFKEEQRKTPISPTVIRFTAAQIVVSHRRKQKREMMRGKEKKTKERKNRCSVPVFCFLFVHAVFMLQNEETGKKR